MAWRTLVASLAFTTIVRAALTTFGTNTSLTIANDRLTAVVDKTFGAVVNLTLDGQNLLGQRSGSTGIGPYLDCSCTPDGFWTPGSDSPTYQLLNGTDSTGTAWGGIIMSDTYPSTGQVLEQYWFLRDGETGLHMFSRAAYSNSTPQGLGEMRTLLRPNIDLWTHLSTNDKTSAPLPYYNHASVVLNRTGAPITVQDATWYLPNRSDPYVTHYSDYFTKYTFADVWRDHKAHGIFSDGSTSADGSTFGAWFVMNTVDTYFGGPTHSDLTVDGIVYNYIVSNHHGAPTPNMTAGFDRTFGPGYYHFNKGPAGASLEELRADAAQYADDQWAVEFYESIAEFVPGYVAPSKRGVWKGIVGLPEGAERPIAILSQVGVDYQDNVLDLTAHQYWADIDRQSGSVEIKNVKPGEHRLTVYADGIFGQHEEEGIVVSAAETTTTSITWQAESAGTELWRIGYPDKSGGDWRHGYERDPVHPLHPEEYRIYWAAYDYLDDFPDGVTFEVGKSSEVEDFNYVHWSVFGGKANSNRPEPVYGDGNINNWTVLFNVEEEQLLNKEKATFTVQLAGAKTAAGNLDTFNASEPYWNFDYTVVVNNHELEPWTIPYNASASCATRSAVTCHHLAHKFVFDAGLLQGGKNELILSLPFNATGWTSAVLPESVYVQYDALRLEVQ
ncbi:polysaccharide lyase family 4 protein [Zasmidium cellare ATCC 36951]|uniref:rhamnogalacturonan endolyase n=1 Tax=Zasmidium cellare ATCC 36951 TaxID=1080233 RepID=A0A6A6CGV8_ZASCE|nr:polysaccharide lyase family 4 protein [Zasmidium cellare ATCC 36951]KAF2166291.1 polysaccharide lyase family 4 protein [Zasmidium cellare ATCC 36951]